MGTEAANSLHMADLEVDDDEWQISAWFLEDQKKETPIAKLDFDQQLFATTGTFRAAEREEGFEVFSKHHFYEMFGDFPSNFGPEDLDRLTVCPYDYNDDAKEWTNQITGGNPLIFHFAGNEWLCACTIFAREGFQTATQKFQMKCLESFELWKDLVEDSIQEVTYAVSDMTSKKGVAIAKRDDGSYDDRRLNDGPYDDRRLNDGPYDDRRLNDGPYDDRRLKTGRRLNDGPYDDRRLNDGPYDDRRLNDGPYDDRRLMRGRHLNDGPYDDRRLNDGPYDDRRLNRGRRLNDGPYDDRRLNDGPYDDRRLKTGRRLNDGPYEVRL
jgi:hypothetical protein